MKQFIRYNALYFYILPRFRDMKSRGKRLINSIVYSDPTWLGQIVLIYLFWTRCALSSTGLPSLKGFKRVVTVSSHLLIYWCVAVTGGWSRRSTRASSKGSSTWTLCWCRWRTACDPSTTGVCTPSGESRTCPHHRLTSPCKNPHLNTVMARTISTPTNLCGHVFPFSTVLSYAARMCVYLHRSDLVLGRHS